MTRTRFLTNSNSHNALRTIAGCVLIALAAAALSAGCAKPRKTTYDDEHGRAGERTVKTPNEIPPEDRRLVVERQGPKRTYTLSSRDESTAEPNDVPPPPAAGPPPAREAGVRIYEVQPKDTLWQLSERFYGHSRHWRRIYAANRNRVNDPRELPVGIKLIIP